MLPVSSSFLDTIATSHTIATVAQVVDRVEGTTQVRTVRELPVAGGEVTVDRTASVRRRCKVTLHDPDLVPADAVDLLHPAAGYELRLWRGVVLPDGTEELVPLGVFGMSKPTVETDGSGGVRIQVDGFDRSRRVQRARFTDTYVVASGTRHVDAAATIVSDRIGTVQTSLVPSTRTLPRTVYDAGDDPWKAVGDLAASIGCEALFDPSGRFVVDEVPDPSTLQSVVTYRRGEDATHLSLSRGLDEDQTYNGVVVTGESTDLPAPVRAVAWDDDPQSPTYRGGPFGEVPKFYTSQFITTVAQAQRVADAMLRDSLGVIEDIAFDAVVNPALTATDVIRVVDDVLAVDAAYVVQALTIPLDAGRPMKVSTRRRTTAEPPGTI